MQTATEIQGEKISKQAATLWFTYGKGARAEATRLAWLNARGSERRAFWFAVAESIADAAPHTKDADCTLGEDGCCTVCGVSHGEPR